jgi:hypothetical protein
MRRAKNGSPREFFFCGLRFETTAWLRMQSDAKRSPPEDVPAICRLQGDFHTLQGEPILLLTNFIILSKS